MPVIGYKQLPGFYLDTTRLLKKSGTALIVKRSSKSREKRIHLNHPEDFTTKNYRAALPLKHFHKYPKANLRRRSFVSFF